LILKPKRKQTLTPHPAAVNEIKKGSLADQDPSTFFKMNPMVVLTRYLVSLARRGSKSLRRMSPYSFLTVLREAQAGQPLGM